VGWRAYTVSKLFSLALLATDAAPAAAFDASRPNPPDNGFSSSARASSSASPGSSPAGVAFEPDRRAVSNWEAEARDHLDLSSQTKAKLVGGPDVPGIPRCVKLNNYWCIKAARWTGEIAADAEGHVAFASAIEGAAAAALLLRRYYLDYNRRSARAILSHWAPAQCAGVTAAAGRLRKSRAAEAAALTGIAPFGIQNTLRARWLAIHRRGFSRPGKTNVLHRSVVPTVSLAMMRAPEIAVGMGEPQRTPINIAALEFAVPAAEPLGTACAGDSARLQNYASRAIEGIAESPEDDLNLFLADGMPAPHLLRMLENMAKVEIGPLVPRPDLIAAAIARVSSKSKKEGAPPVPPPAVSEASQQAH
jgi:hypothetical protein